MARRGGRARRRGGFAVAVVLALGAVNLIDLAPAPAASSCGSSGAKTLAASPKVRVYQALSTAEGDSPVYACLKATGKSWLLGPHAVRGWMASMPGPFAIHVKWVAGIEHRQVGQDTGVLYSSARNVGSGKSKPHCLLGGADRPGQLPKIRRVFLTPSGTLVWVALIPTQSTTQIGACEGVNSRVVAEGGEIDAGSVSLRGFRLSWSDQSGKHSVTLG